MPFWKARPLKQDTKPPGLRRGYTTGTCAAAASKAATLLFLTGRKQGEVTVILPNGGKATLRLHRCEPTIGGAVASVIKDGGDDPDVTKGAEIIAHIGEERGEGKEAFRFRIGRAEFVILGGEGVGVVTKKGLPVAPDEPAINPVPRRMIEAAIREAIPSLRDLSTTLFVTISVPQGEEIARKTMNPRLGIIGGISILGTTGIVVPFSISAYRASIRCAVDVATASGLRNLVFSTGRCTEEVVRKVLDLPEDAFILVGDHMAFALRISPPSLESVTIAGQFGKMSKLALDRFNTHFSQSSIDLDRIADLAEEEGFRGEGIRRANTAREAFQVLKDLGANRVFRRICEEVKRNGERRVGGRFRIGVILVDYNGEVVERLK